MHISDIPELVAALQPHSPVPFFLGSTGIGKTHSVAEGAKQAGRTMAAIPPLSTMLPEDAGGIPVPNLSDGIANYIPPKYWHIEPNSLIFLDELNLATTDVQTALCSVLWPLADGKRYVGSKEIPSDAIVVAAGMPPSPGSPARPLPHFLRSRLRIIEVTNNSNDWCIWATNNRINPRIVSFINSRADLLCPDPPIGQEIEPFPTPRAWARISFILKEENTSEPVLHASIAGMVGAGAASEFLSFYENTASLPAPESILKGTKKFPTNPSHATAVASSVAQLILNAEKPIKWASHFYRESIKWPKEYVVGLIFPVLFQNQTPKWRCENHFDISVILTNSNYRTWYNEYSSIINEALS